MQAELEAGLEALDLPTDLSAPLLAYIELLAKWNKAYNLTAIRDPEEMVVLHLLDSLSAASCVSGQSILDVGTGAGLPGIPLAIAFPEKQFTLLDTNGKKVRFLDHAIRQLDLANVSAVKSRIETFAPETRFDAIISRAFSALEPFVSACAPLLDTDGVLLAMKGKLPKEEIAALNEAQWEVSFAELRVPGLEAERHMVTLKPRGHTE